MKLVVGLGNKGEKYKNTRHNVGFFVVNRLQSTVYCECEWRFEKIFLAEVCSLKADSVLIAKPQTMMNDSGIAVKKLTDFYKIDPDDLWVIYDDLDIALGQYKIQKGKGPKDHNGLLSIYQKLGSKDFWHVRIGIENRSQASEVGDQKIPGEQYVLQDFGQEEREVLNKVIEKVVNEITNNL